MPWNVAAFLAEGFEETEAIAVIDLMRRAKMNVRLVAVGPAASSGSAVVSSARGIRVSCDGDLESFDPSKIDLLFLPGGNPGTPNLKKEARLEPLFRKHHEAGRWIAAICAAPTILGSWGLLRGRGATCFPGLEKQMEPLGSFIDAPVVVDGNIVTSRGMGTSIDLGLALVRLAGSEAEAQALAETIVYRSWGASTVRVCGRSGQAP